AQVTAVVGDCGGGQRKAAGKMGQVWAELTGGLSAADGMAVDAPRTQENLLSALCNLVCGGWRRLRLILKPGGKFFGWQSHHQQAHVGVLYPTELRTFAQKLA